MVGIVLATREGNLPRHKRRAQNLDSSSEDGSCVLSQRSSSMRGAETEPKADDNSEESSVLGEGRVRGGGEAKRKHRKLDSSSEDGSVREGGGEARPGNDASDDDLPLGACASNFRRDIPRAIPKDHSKRRLSSETRRRPPQWKEETQRTDAKDDLKRRLSSETRRLSSGTDAKEHLTHLIQNKRRHPQWKNMREECAMMTSSSAGEPLRKITPVRGG